MRVEEERRRKKKEHEKTHKEKQQRPDIKFKVSGGNRKNNKVWDEEHVQIHRGKGAPCKYKKQEDKSRGKKSKNSVQTKNNERVVDVAAWLFFFILFMSILLI